MDLHGGHAARITAVNGDADYENRGERRRIDTPVAAQLRVIKCWDIVGELPATTSLANRKAGEEGQRTLTLSIIATGAAVNKFVPRVQKGGRRYCRRQAVNPVQQSRPTTASDHAVGSGTDWPAAVASAPPPAPMPTTTPKCAFHCS